MTAAIEQTSRFRRLTFQILEARDDPSLVSKIDDIALSLLIFINVAATVLETVHDVGSQYSELFATIERVSVTIFLVEYVLRLWVCSMHPRYRHPITGRLRFAFTPMMLLDFLAIAPFFLPHFFVVDLRTFRALRLMRLFRVFKLARYFVAMRTIATVLRSRSEELLTTLFAVAILLLFSASVVYYAEHDAQPEQFSSIPAAMWWGVTTLTTVGYGDVYPITVGGRIFGALIAILGVGLFAMPAGILASGFHEEMTRRRRPPTCPHCAKPLDVRPDELSPDSQSVN